MGLTAKKIEKFLNGTPKLVALAFFGGLFPVSFLYHAYRFTGVAPFYWLLEWPKPFLDVVLPRGIRVGGEVLANEEGAMVVSYLVYSYLLLYLLLREERASERSLTKG